jgi:hypothetical protein
MYSFQFTCVEVLEHMIYMHPNKALYYIYFRTVWGLWLRSRLEGLAFRCARARSNPYRTHSSWHGTVHSLHPPT